MEFLAYSLVAAYAANLIHWRFRRSERMSCPPHTVGVLIAFLIWIAAILVLIVLSQIEVIPTNEWSLVVALAGLTVQQIYSIWLRHQWRVFGEQTAASIEPAIPSRSPVARFDLWANSKFIKPTSNNWPTWAPLHSPEVRAIWHHLTPAERERLAVDTWQRAMVFGDRIGSLSVIPWLVIFVAAFLAFEFAWYWIIAAVVFDVFFVVLWIWPRIRAEQRKGAELLYATEWARSQGFTAENLKLMRLPWFK